MVDDAILTSRDKEILRGDVDPDKYDDFRNRRYKIRSRVRRRTRSLVQEINLLLDSEEEELVNEFLQTIASQVDGLNSSDMEHRIDRIRRDLDKIENNELASVRSKLEEIEDELNG